jgi:apolipoprotein N-acyltransferase
VLGKEVLAVLKEKGIGMIDSGRTSIEEGRYGEILFFDGSLGQVVERRHKRLLIPFGEYLPEVFAQGLSLFGMSSEVEAIKNIRSYARSREPFSQRVFEHKGVRLGVLACSEIFAPFGYKEVSDVGADILINIASHSWARNSAPLLFNQTYAMARVHVAYTRKPYIQATNYAPSYAIFPAIF